jgi:RHS repeat-associated protein
MGGDTTGANRTTTIFSYDRETFRLTQLKTTRASDGAVLQNLQYTYDPVGNITEILDSAQQAVFFDNDVVLPVMAYVYDAIYRLTEGKGRELAGGLADVQRDHNDLPLQSLPFANDTNAVRNYTEAYTYDAVGNILSMSHDSGSPSTSWTRHYAYETDASSNPMSNRLTGTSLPGDASNVYSATYTHDPHGNMTAMPHLASITWDHHDQMASADLGGGGIVHFTYDAAGQRVRKVWVHSGLIEERIYLGGYEVYRTRTASDGALEFERQTLHVMDGDKRVTLVETTTVDADAGGGFTPTTVERFQLGNHLGSVALEVDDTGRVLSYAEYHPYGTTAYVAGTSAAEVSAKRYRYTGKERDEETGLYYHGARHYAPWLARWTAADPKGVSDHPCPYAYCANNPIVFVDRDGRERTQAEIAAENARMLAQKAVQLREEGVPAEEFQKVEALSIWYKDLAKKLTVIEFQVKGDIWIDQRTESLKGTIERKKSDAEAAGKKFTDEAVKNERQQIDSLTAAKDALDKSLQAGAAHGSDLLTLANVVHNEAGAYGTEEKKAMAYAYLNKTGNVVREPQKGEVSHYKELDARWDSLSDTQRLQFVKSFPTSVEAARTRLDDPNPAQSDPTARARHWVSPQGLDPFTSSTDRSKYYKRDYGSAKGKAFPIWATDPKDPKNAKLQEGKHAIHTRDYTEYTVGKIPGEHFLFYRGVK